MEGRRTEEEVEPVIGAWINGNRNRKSENVPFLYIFHARAERKTTNGIAIINS